MKHLAVIDIGKTNAKLVLLDETGETLREWRQANSIKQAPPYPHIDLDRQWRFVLDALKEASSAYDIDAVIPITHGATAALIDGKGELALPIMDYEAAIPAPFSEDYSGLRPSFSETGSPNLPNGLNLGRQIYYQSQAFPDEFARTEEILMLPQYWSYRLTGTLASEATSLGCHTDLWDYKAQDFSSLVYKEEWHNIFPPQVKPGNIVGTVRPDLGLPHSIKVMSGIHDSNAGFLPHLASQSGPFAVLSTGTWVISMAGNGEIPSLDEARDTLCNTNAYGNPIPTARFMGGREYDRLIPKERQADTISIDDLIFSATKETIPLPNQGGIGGPFPSASEQPQSEYSAAAAIIYLAMMTDQCLTLINAQGPIIIEGPFATNPAFAATLSHLRNTEVACASETAGTTAGALTLWLGTISRAPSSVFKPHNKNLKDALLARRSSWLSALMP